MKDNIYSEYILETRVTTKYLKKYLDGNDDITFKEIYINSNKKIKATLVFIEGLTDLNQINETLIKPLTQQKELEQAKKEKDIIDLIDKGTVYFGNQKTLDNLQEVIDKILQGFTCLVFDEEEKGIIFETKKIPQRSIDEPTDEPVIKGPKEAFIESLRINTTLIRRRIRNHNLKIKQFDIGEEGKINVAIAYMDNLVDKRILDDLIKKIREIKVKSLTSVGIFEENFVEKKYSLFPQVRYSERPDKVSVNILEGKIGIIIDGFPIVYIVPSTINMFLQSPEDYSNSVFVGSFLRILRYICAFLSLTLPAFYISITTFHHEMIPSDLAISIIKSKQGVPINTFLEVILMLLAFEILLEAGARLPKTIGQTISIVGGLVIGEAAVNAKFFSPGVVVIVAIAAVCGFVIPSQDLSNSLRLIRFILVIAASIAGLFGLVVVSIWVLYLLCKTENFGVPYTTPFSNNKGKNLFQDVIIRKQS